MRDHFRHRQDAPATYPDSISDVSSIPSSLAALDASAEQGSSNQTALEVQRCSGCMREVVKNDIDMQEGPGVVCTMRGYKASRFDRVIRVPMKLIFSCSLDALSGKCLDISPYATPKRHRFFSALSIDQASRLDIFEVVPEAGLPSTSLRYQKGSYCAISYVWKGVQDDRSTRERFFEYYRADFAIKGAEHGDPISILVLRKIARAAQKLKVGLSGIDRITQENLNAVNGQPVEYSTSNSSDFIWLDRMSIMQSTKEDKMWQIQGMYDLYHDSNTIILPGGLRRLVCIDEETSWSHRAWTLLGS